MKKRVYEMTCPQCGKKVRAETALGVPDGEHEDYPLKKMKFKCDSCHTRFSISLPVDIPEIQKKWEAGEDLI